MKSTINTANQFGTTVNENAVDTYCIVGMSASTSLNHRSRGQATVEYALIMLVAAVIATLVITWATAGGGAGKIGGFFDAIVERILSKSAGMF